MINKVILMGRLTADPELKQTSNNIAVCSFTVAVNRPYSKDRESKADFISVTAWRAAAEFVAKYFSKGKMIIVEGSLQNNNYEKDGVKHYSMVVQASNVSFGESKNGSQAAAESEPKQDSTAAKNELSGELEGSLEDFEAILSDGDAPF